MSHRILVCDDHAIVLDAISDMLEAGFSGCTVVQASGFHQAWELLEVELPDLIVCDLMMPDCPPLEGIAGIQARAPKTPICALTGSQDEALMLALLNAGVAGFVGKFSSGEVIKAAAQLILAGGRYIPEQVLGLLGSPTAEPTDPAIRLTAQQRKVLGHAAKGLSTKEIAAELSVAPSTVKTHLEQAMRALGASTRYEAVHKARESGLI